MSKLPLTNDLGLTIRSGIGDQEICILFTNDDERVVGRVWAAGLLVERVLGRRPF